MSERNVEATVIVCLSGLLAGCLLGYSGVAIQFTNDISKCSRYTTSSDCGRVDSVCFWNASSAAAAIGNCVYRDQNVSCLTAVSQSDCLARPQCTFLGGSCQHGSAWTTAQRNGFEASFVAGGAGFAFIAGPLLRVFRSSTILRLSGILALISTALLAWSWQYPEPNSRLLSNLNLYSSALVLAGATQGLLIVAAPLFSSAAATAEKREYIIYLFQATLAAGVFLVSFAGYLLSTWTTTSSQRLGFHVLHFALFVSAVAQFMCTVLLQAATAAEKESSSTGATEMTAVAPLLKETSPSQADNENDKYGLSAALAFCLAAVMAAGFQFGGAGVLSREIPTFSQTIGTSPVLATSVFMLIALVGSLVALPIKAGGVSNERMAQIGFGAASSAALLCCLATFPVLFPSGLDSKLARGFFVTGLVLCLLSLQAFVSAPLFVLIQNAFPRSLRAVASGFTVFVANAICLVTIFFYPWITDQLPRYGNFFVFGAYAFVLCGCTVGAVALLKPREEQAAV